MLYKNKSTNLKFFECNCCFVPFAKLKRDMALH